MQRVRLQNKRTGLWFCKLLGFSKMEAIFATPLDPFQEVAVRYLFDALGDRYAEVASHAAEVPVLEVAAYVPKDEQHPVLLVVVAGVSAGLVHRRGEPMYHTLYEVCDGNPKWLFGQEARPL